MHSGLILLLWLATVTLLQLLPAHLLGPAVAMCLLLGLGFARARTVRLLRRVRILLAAIFVLFAWFTPGEALLLDWPRLGPSREGSLLALEHAGRLVAIVCAVALLLERLPVERLVSGLYTLGRPLGLLGLSAERLALRLLLVLRYVDASPRASGAGHWKDWLQDDAGAIEATPVRLRRERFGWADALLSAGVFVCVLWWGLA